MTDVQAPSLTEVEQFSLQLDSGETLVFAVEPGDPDVPASDLREHLNFALRLRVTFHRDGERLVADAVEHGLGPAAASVDPHLGHTPGESTPPRTPHPAAPTAADATLELETEFVPGGSGVSVAQALDTATSEPALMTGILLRDADGTIWFCDQLGEGDAPKCGSPRLWVANFPANEAVFAPENALATGAQTAFGVTWLPSHQMFGVILPARADRAD